MNPFSADGGLLFRPDAAALDLTGAAADELADHFVDRLDHAFVFQNVVWQFPDTLDLMTPDGRTADARTEIATRHRCLDLDGFDDWHNFGERIFALLFR